MKSRAKLLIVLLGVIQLPITCSRKAPALTVRVLAHKHAFEPSVIRVKQGQTVRLEILTSDVQHGFQDKGLGIEESVQKGKPAVVIFTADRKGEFPFRCNVVCGAGHDDMQGTIIIE